MAKTMVCRADIYIGAGSDGEKLYNQMQADALSLNMTNNQDEPNLSALLLMTYKHWKDSQKVTKLKTAAG